MRPSEGGPRERARLGGVAALADDELLTLILGHGHRGRAVGQVAAELLSSAGGLEGLARSGPARLAKVSGMGDAKALRVVASVELGRRVQLRRAGHRITLATPEQVARAFGPRIGVLEHEEMWVLSVDGRNRLRAARQVARGGMHGVAVAAREILSTALADGASAMLLVHNHPSGCPTPSEADVHMTLQVARAADVVGVPLLDHVVVVADGAYVSMLEAGLLTDVSVGMTRAPQRSAAGASARRAR